MAVEAIDEYLTASEECLKFRKADDGCLGYPATLLLFCTVNALVTYLKGDEVEIDGKEHKITSGEPFRVLNHSCFGLSLGHTQIKALESWYRNPLVHNAIIDEGLSLLPEDADQPFIFRAGPIGIRVFAYHKLVAKAWARFPKERIRSWEASRKKTKLPTSTG